MSPFQNIYPVSLASANAALGWLLYQPLELAFGLLLVAIGLLIILTTVGSTIHDRRSALGVSSSFSR